MSYNFHYTMLAVYFYSTVLLLIDINMILYNNNKYRELIAFKTINVKEEDFLLVDGKICTKNENNTNKKILKFR